MRSEYDLIVVGAGAGGITSGVTAAGFGKKVLLIDKDKPGGECTWYGCVPSKALIHEAGIYHTIRERQGHAQVDSARVFQHIREVQQGIYQHESPEALAKSGIDYLQGAAQFIGPRTLKVGTQELRGKKIILATGSSPLIPPVKGLDQIPYLTNESVFNQDSLPGSMIILGGGPIGVELAQAFNRLGVKIQLVEMADTILFREEPEMSAMVSQRLENEGVTLLTGAKAVGVSEEDHSVVLTYQQKGVNKTIQGDKLLVAVGRKPNTASLELEKGGIQYDNRGITVNSKLQTTAKGVYAVGDVTGPYRFSHTANAQGILATQNAILPIQRKISYKNLPRVTFTDPELARTGMTEEEARNKYGDKIRVYTMDLNDLDRTKTGGPVPGMVKMILSGGGKILGTSILAERAGEMICEVQVIKSLGINMGKLAGIIHPYPTYGEVFQKLGKKILVDNLLNLPVVRIFTKK